MQVNNPGALQREPPDDITLAREAGTHGPTPARGLGRRARALDAHCRSAGATHVKRQIDEVEMHTDAVEASGRPSTSYASHHLRAPDAQTRKRQVGGQPSTTYNRRHPTRVNR